MEFTVVVSSPELLMEARAGTVTLKLQGCSPGLLNAMFWLADIAILAIIVLLCVMCCCANPPRQKTQVPPPQPHNRLIWS